MRCSFLRSCRRFRDRRIRRARPRRRGIRLGRLGIAQRRSVEGDAVGVVDEPVEDGVGEGGLADDLVPGPHRELAGDDGGAAAVALLDDLHQVATLGSGQALGAPVVQDQQVDAGDLAEQPVEAPVAACELEVGEETRQPVIKDGPVGAARGMAERAGEPRLAYAAGSGDQDRAVPVDPPAGGRGSGTGHGRGRGRPVVHVLHAGVAVAQVGSAQSRLEAAGAAPGLLTVEHQPDPGDGIEAAAAILRDELGESLCHAVELQRVQRLVGGVGEQGHLPSGQWKNCGPRMLAWGIGGASGG